MTVKTAHLAIQHRQDVQEAFELLMGVQLRLTQQRLRSKAQQHRRGAIQGHQRRTPAT